MRGEAGEGDNMSLLRSLVARVPAVAPVSSLSLNGGGARIVHVRTQATFAGDSKVPPRPPMVGIFKTIGTLVVMAGSVAGGSWLSKELVNFNEEQGLWEVPEDD